MRKLCSITILIALTPFFGCEKGWVWLLDEPYTVKVSIKETERTEFHIPDDGFFIRIFKKRTGNSWDGYSFEDYVGKVSVSEGQSQVIENDIKAANYWFIVGFRAINNNTNNSNNSSDRRSGFTPGTFDSGGALIRGFEAGQRIKNQRRMEKLMEEEAVAKMTPKERKVYYEYKRKKELERKEKRKKRRMLFGFALWIAWSFSTPIP